MHHQAKRDRRRVAGDHVLNGRTRHTTVFTFDMRNYAMTNTPKIEYEAVLLGGSEATMYSPLDPVVSITINNGIHDYVFTPDQIDSIIIRKLKP